MIPKGNGEKGHPDPQVKELRTQRMFANGRETGRIDIPRLEQSPGSAQGRGGRAVEGTGLENRRGREITVGSNPTPSARQLISPQSENKAG
jgi:hypothetical protein